MLTPGVKLTSAEVPVMLPIVKPVTGSQGGGAKVVNVAVVVPVGIPPVAQTGVTTTVYVVLGVRPVRATGEAVGAGVTVVAVPPCGV